MIRRSTLTVIVASRAGGGSCFGDSGGVVFLNGYVLGDVSYVNSFSCNVPGSCQRDDTA